MVNEMTRKERTTTARANSGRHVSSRHQPASVPGVFYSIFIFNFFFGQVFSLKPRKRRTSTRCEDSSPVKEPRTGALREAGASSWIGSSISTRPPKTLLQSRRCLSSDGNSLRWEGNLLQLMKTITFQKSTTDFVLEHPALGKTVFSAPDEGSFGKWFAALAAAVDATTL